ncbi:hypothetical protein [Acetobacter pasteurianus]|uniref:hypothetical protein n=1 Tax=Acetobacter pasteurianus TaxID=438 RepID=UPI0005A2293B|nr:hypothetical protein [Acetobacter pasteurianus]GCD65302.1 hypothetical protein NBRC3279_0793 [Acetobacter pasteurianus NBRC 3279]GCD71612.1 hypothetical protein NBRC3284_0768 [Acetobacter pasteurianus NBRC 3284]
MANNIHIFCELKTSAENGTAVIAKIKELGSWARISPSFWYVDSLLTASGARDQLGPLLKEGDCLFVVDASNGQAAWKGVSGQVATFLKAHWSN